MLVFYSFTKRQTKTSTTTLTRGPTTRRGEAIVEIVELKFPSSAETHPPTDRRTERMNGMMI